MSEQVTFADLGISPEILEAIELLGFDTPSGIQEKAIPVALQGRDIVGQSHTGSGKTLAFVIPALETIDPQARDGVQVLVLTPTRELAQQIYREIQKLSLFVEGVSAVAVYGGASFRPQLDAFRRGVQFVVGTPGRILDHLESGAMDVSRLRMLILDEADQMLDMGFIEDIEHLCAKVPKERQTLFFSATMSPQVKGLMMSLTRDAEFIAIERPTMTVPTIDQIYHELLPASRLEVLSRLLDTGRIKLGIVFANTKRVVDDVVDGLLARGHAVDRLHGDMPQTLRERVMDSYRKGSLKVLVATDVAARGIDVDNIDTVVNYELPRDPEDYVHRIGRTARAGRSGRAISFVGRRDFSLLARIERFIKAKLRFEPVITGAKVAQLKQEAIVDDLLEKLSVLHTRLAKAEPVSAEPVEGAEASEDAVSTLATPGIELPDCLSDIEADPKAIAAALFMMLEERGSHPILPIPEDKPSHREQRKSADGAPSGKARFDIDGDVTKMFVNAGKRLGIRPKDIAGMFYNGAKLPKGSLGDIRMFDKFTLVEVAPEFVQQVTDTIGSTKLCGFDVIVRKDEGEGARAPRPFRNDRGDGPGSRPRGEFRPRDNSSWVDDNDVDPEFIRALEGGDGDARPARPRKNFAGRESSSRAPYSRDSRESRDYAPRDYSSRPSGSASYPGPSARRASSYQDDSAAPRKSRRGAGRFESADQPSSASPFWNKVGKRGRKG